VEGEQAMTREDEFMTVGEAIKYLGISQSKIARLIRDKKLATEADALDGRLKLVRRADVEKLGEQSIRGKNAA
jgi:excisionase family DNA binding protein